MTKSHWREKRNEAKVSRCVLKPSQDGDIPGLGQPTDQQKSLLAQLFGCCRVVWNDALSYCQEKYNKGEKKPNNKELSKRLTELKKTEEKIWLGEVSSIPLQQSLRDLDQAYANFFKSCKGERKGKKLKPPKFKKRKSKQSARFTDNGFRVNQHSVYLPKIGNLKIVWTREFPSQPSSVTVIKDSADRYFLSFVVEIVPEKLPDNGPSVGIDLGILDFATFSNGEKVKAPKPLKKKLKTLKRLQRKFSRTVKGSKRRERSRKKVAKLHAKIADTRKDFLHKLSTRVIRENQVIALEDLNTSGLIKNRKLSRAISDLGWRAFRDMLTAKADKDGRDLRIIDRWEATTQKCSCCGEKGGKKELKVREWTCLFCGSIHDRDLNASQNILYVAVGHTETLKGRGDKPSRKRQRKCQTAGLAAVSVEASTTFEPIQLSLF
jgi:putative transposase